ncbi:MAG: glycerophosphodiester phosphodiesterase [Bacilli bacterium]|nr:glycerophosphodiester phosphodiesterase [Bacilli bacterium]
MKIIAHRGNDGIHVENSMESILNSLTISYIDGVEFDIRHTKDYDFVIHHDPFYKGYYIEKTRLSVLQKKGLNSLEEVLKNINSDKIIMIEIKEESGKFKYMLTKLHKLLKKYNLNYYLCSFNYDLVSYLKKKYPIYNVGLLIGIKLNLNKMDNSFDFNMINFRHAKKAPLKETFIWTVNDLKTFEMVKDNQNVITDKAKEIYDFIYDEK